jgi:hypothetical protein
MGEELGMTDCLITGVILIEGDRMFNGDLFRQGDTYIVNCNEASEAVADVTDDMKWIGVGGDYWTRRGVYVIPMHVAQFSPAALEYMR